MEPICIRILSYRSSQRYAVLRTVESALRLALQAQPGLQVEISEVSQLEEILKVTQVLILPSLEINGQLVCVGRFPRRAEVVGWLNAAYKIITEGSMTKRKVLFLCTGNSCRSQMAEAIVNARLGEAWQAVSAGTQPAGYVHPLAIEVLQEIGIAHNGESKSADQFRQVAFDLVVTVCDDAAENCPFWLGQGVRVHLGFPDPAKAQGSSEEILAAFRAVRDDMLVKVPALLAAQG